MSKTTRTSAKQIRELEAHARETIDKSARLYARYEYDATGKAYAVINGTRTAYASNTALYDAVAEMVLTKQAEEFQSEPEPERIIYATEPTEATENAAHLADLAEQAAHDVETAATICDADAYDNRAQMYAAAAADEATRYDADDATERHAARAARAAEQARAALTARVNAGLTDADTAAALNSDYARTLTLEAIEKAGADPEDIATDAMNDANEAMGEASDALSKTEAAALEYDADASAAFAAETRAAADRAEQAADRAWSAATTPSACTLADIASEDAASARAYADRATETAEQCARELEQRAEIIAQIEDPQHREYIRATAEAHQWTPDETRANIAYYAANRTANAAARALLAEYAETTGRSIEQDDDEYLAAHRVASDEVTGVSARATGYDREIVAAMVERIAQAVRDDMPTGPENYRPTYQRAELLAYLGEPDDYDLAAIEHEATAYDPATGRTVWAVDAETLAAIAERHQLQFYAPAF